MSGRTNDPSIHHRFQCDSKSNVTINITLLDTQWLEPIFCVGNTITWYWWSSSLALVVSVLGIAANLYCFYLFSRVKSLRQTSYVFYLRFLSLADSFCLLIELTQAINEYFITNKSFSNTWNLRLNRKLIRFLTDVFQLNSTWLICAFSIQRCISITSPLLVRRFLSVTKAKLNFIYIFLLTILIQTTGLFLSDCYLQYTHHSNHLLAFYQHFNQLTCIVVIPVVIILPCNAIVFYRILKRRRMIKSGNFHSFKINKNRIEIPMTEISKCNTTKPTVSLLTQKHLQHIKDIVKHETESLSAVTTDDMYSTHDDTRSIDANFQINLINLKKNKKYVLRAKVYRDIKIFLLMVYSISFLVFVLPETLLKFFNYKMNKAWSLSGEFLMVFYMLKLLYYSSNFLAYVTLVAFSSKKSVKKSRGF